MPYLITPLKVPMDNEEYIMFSAILKKKIGIRLEPRKYKHIASRLRRRAKIKFKSFNQYIQFLESDDAAAEWEELIDEITVPETYFFRDTNQCHALKDYILNGLINSKQDRKLRIWSAGCSTGEEAYTIAIIVAQAIPGFKRWDIQIVGTDINRRSIEKARKGIYSEKSFRGMSREETSNQFFNKKIDGMCVRDSIKSLVRFGVSNLSQDEESIFPNIYSDFDVIVCRNVFIYLEENVVNNILLRFYNSLLPNGHLILGHSEGSFFLKKKFKPIRTNDIFIYERKETAFHEMGVAPPIIRHGQNRQWSMKTEEQVFSNSQKKVTENRQSSMGTPPNSHSRFNKKAAGSSNYQKALALYFQKKYSLAEEEIASLLKKDDDNVEGLILASLIRINLGDLKKAITSINKVQEIDEFLPDAHFISGIIHENENNYEEAIRAYKAALFLDEEFFLSYFMLGCLYRKTGKTADSILFFKNALSVIGSKEEEKVRLLAGGFTKKVLENLCTKGIEGQIDNNE